MDSKPLTVMKHLPLDIYADMPSAMKAYITHYGWHFTKRAFEYAVSQMMRKNPASEKTEPIEPWTKDQVEELLSRNGVKLNNCVMYDAAFVANMCKADYYKSSVPDEAHVALFVKDYLDDPDASDDVAFRRWVATMFGNGTPVDWEEIL